MFPSFARNLVNSVVTKLAVKYVRAIVHLNTNKLDMNPFLVTLYYKMMNDALRIMPAKMLSEVYSITCQMGKLSKNF